MRTITITCCALLFSCHAATHAPQIERLHFIRLLLLHCFHYRISAPGTARKGFVAYWANTTQPFGKGGQGCPKAPTLALDLLCLPAPCSLVQVRPKITNPANVYLCYTLPWYPVHTICTTNSKKKQFCNKPPHRTIAKKSSRERGFVTVASSA